MKKVKIIISKTQLKALKYAKGNNNKIENLGRNWWGYPVADKYFHLKTIKALVDKGLAKPVNTIGKYWNMVELTKRALVLLKLEKEIK